MRLTGKTAIVTGAGSGYGAGIAAKFVAEGAQVLVADINGDAANAVSSAIGARPWVVDMADNTSVRRMAGKLPNPDIFVNAAGVTPPPSPMEDTDDEEFDHILKIHTKSLLLMARHFLPKMKARQSGAILNLASTTATAPKPDLTWYNASQGWIVTATQSMAAELAPHGIRVNAINLMRGEERPAPLPLGGQVSPQDIGNAACFLCSDEASMITGIAMDVDGGLKT